MQERLCTALVWLAIGFFSCFSYAGQDPVPWQLTPDTGFPTTNVGSQSTIVYTLTSHLPHPAVMVTSMKINGPGITVADGCNQVKLSPNATCNITISFTPTQAGTTTFQLIYGYHSNRIPLPQLTAVATGTQPRYSLSGSIPNFSSSISPSGDYNFSAVFTNSGSLALTDCFAGDANGQNQFILSPSSRATVTVLTNSCGTTGSHIGLSPTSPNNTCTVTGKLSAPYEAGNFTLAALMTCAQASSEPVVSSEINTPTIGFTGTFTIPTPFPTILYDDLAPFVTTKFTNTGNVELTDCYATGTGFTLSAPLSGNIVTTSQPSTCGSLASKITLQPTDSCYLYGQLKDLVAPTVNDVLTASVVCAEASASPAKTFDIAASTGSCTSLTVTPTLLLPASTYVYADNVVQFKIQNICASQSIVLGDVSITPSAGSATITTNTTYDLCSGNTLAAGNHCLVTASVIPLTTSTLTVTASVTASSPSGGSPATGSTTATTVSSNQQSTHHLYFVNQCDFDVWYGIGNAAGTSGNATPDPNLTTYPGGAPPSAYYLPAQVSGQAPSTIDLSVSSYINGAIWPRTGCALQSGQFVCATGYCSTISGTATCVSGTATTGMPLNPTTRLEEYLSPTAGADGVYDVSIINGMTVPVEMKAFGPLGDNSVGSSPGNPSDVYTCSSAGAIIQPAASSLLAACPWTFDPSSSLTSISNVNSDFYWVTPGADNGCTSSVSPLCGMAYNVAPPANPGTINRTTGDFLGFSTLANYIGYTASSQWGTQNLYNIYGMGTTISGYGPPGNYTVLIGCIYDKTTDTANSCNLGNLPNTAAYQHCCGCVDWTMTTPNTPCGGGSTYWPGTGTNQLWTTDTPSLATVTYNIQDAVTWLKTGCPTSYVYQFDDTASSFQCNTDGSTQLYTSYQITFCPGGITGLPTGATDGRSTVP